MGQILHGCASTTAALRRTLQHSQESLKQMASRYHINVKTVAKWRKRTSVEDLPMGPPRNRHSSVLTSEQEAMIVAFRRQTLLPLDHCLYALQPSIPHLTRSSLHRCLKRHDISRLPDVGDKPVKKKFKQYPIGYFHIDIAEVCTEQGRLYLFVAIDRTSKFAYAESHLKQTRDTACDFLRRLISVAPYRLHTILTDNGIQFTNRAKDKWAFMHLFDRICRQNGIEQRLTKTNHPWTRRTSSANESNDHRSDRQALLL